MTPNDVKFVVDNIDDFIQVPDGVNRLRKAVLTLAMSGRLVPKIKKEGTAEDLFKEIQSELKNKVEVRKKKVSELIPPNDEEIPFDIPTTWKWVRITEIGQVFGGGTPSTSKSDNFTVPTARDSIPWISPADMRRQTSMYVTHGRQSLTIEGYNNSSAKLMPSGTIIFSSRAPIGYVGIATNPLSTNQGFKSIVPATGISPEYVYWFLRMRAEDINARATGTTFKEISGAGFAKEIIALPPALEQNRIADKVQEVMMQLDELEMKKRERDEVRTRLARSTMHFLGSGKPEIAFEQLTELVKTPSDIKELEKALLTLAVSGKLVSQDGEDGTAEELYKQIQAERVKTIGALQARKKKAGKLVSLAANEIPFEIPESWKWVRLGEVCHVEMGQSPEGSEVSEIKGGLPFFQGKAEFGEVFPVPKKWCNNPKKIAEEGDVLVSVRAPVGTTNIAKGKSGIGRGLAAIRPYTAMPNVFWRNVIEKFTYKLLEQATGTTFQAIRGVDLTMLVVPLPPIAEQHRIVERFNKVMVLINRLKQVIQ